MIDLKKELILIGLVAVNSYLINSSEAATNDSEVIGDIDTCHQHNRTITAQSAHKTVGWWQCKYFTT